MLNGKLYCKDNSQCYFATSRQVDELSNNANLDVIVKPVVVNGVDEKINVVVDKNDYTKELFSTQNPLRLIDFLKGYVCCLQLTN